MDRAISLEARRIDLSIELPFRLGSAAVDPRAHEIGWGGECRRIQPLTMKVLVALHDKLGEVVTRDELVDRCWDGRFVGEDVINRCISMLRRVAAESGGFSIHTVPREGYRLAQAEQVSPDDEVVAAVGGIPQPPIRARYWLGGIGAAALLLIGGAGLFVFGQVERTNAVMLRPFDVSGDAPVARTFAGAVSADIGSALSAAGVDVVDPDSSGHSKAQFVLSGQSELAGPDLHLTANLQESSDRSVLWSTSFTRPAADMQAMQEQVAANLAAVLQCALETSRKPGGDLDEDTIKLYLKACALQQAVDPPSDQIEGLLQQVTAREPRFAAGWSRLALFAGQAAFTAPPEDAEIMRREARAAVQKALQLDPKSGGAYNAVAEMELGHVPFAMLHRQFQKVLSFDPDDTFTISNECELLMRMGRVDDALQMCRRWSELEPLSPQGAADLIRELIVEGRNSEAENALRRAVRIWPDDGALQALHLDYEARYGDPSRALELVNASDPRPPLRDASFEIYRRLIAARKSRQPAEARAFTSWLEKTAVSDRMDADFVAPMLAEMGDVEGAFRLAFAAPANILAIDPAFLWEPGSLALRRDPRFVALASRFYVAAFWRQTGMWPDFCSIPGSPYNCRAEAARLPLNAWPKTYPSQP